MNSQRLEEIVAELMKPISDVRRSFDTDLSALLEEYLTEAGLHALDAEEEAEAGGGGGGGAGGMVAPNFAELALLLQQSASIYGRKVDFLYQHVLSVSDSLHNNSLEESPEATESPARRKRKESGAAAAVAEGFAPLALQAAAGAAAGAGGAGGGRPPPTLPRLYLELEPRALLPGDAPLTDYAGEAVGLLEDFHVAWRLRAGLLVPHLQHDAAPAAALRPVPLPLLQAAIEAVAPPPPLPEPPSPPPTPPPPDSPAPPPPTPPPPPPCEPESVLSPEVPPVVVRQQRKRKCDGTGELKPVITIDMKISKAGAAAHSAPAEYAVRGAWVARVLARRRVRLLRLRTAARADQRRLAAGFTGWSAEEAARAAAEAARLAARLGPLAGLPGLPGAVTLPASDSDDDGFFEQSSLGDSDASRIDDSLTNANSLMSFGACAAAGASAAGPDIRSLSARVLSAARGGDVRLSRVLRAACRAPRDVSHVFLATLFLANAGALRLLAGPPPRVLLLSQDPALCRAAAAAAAADLAAAPPTS